MVNPKHTTESKGYFAAVPSQEKPVYIALLVSVICGLMAVFIPLCPVTVDVAPNQPVLYNFIGVINQTVGDDAQRQQAFVPLLLYYVAVVLTAVGCAGAFRHLRSSALFLFAGAILFLVFVSLWRSAGVPVTDPAVRMFNGSAIPYLEMICAVGALLAAAASLLHGAGRTPQKRS